MKDEDIEKFQNSLLEKLGEEQVAVIADSIADLISANNQTVDEIKEQAETIEKMKQMNQQLVASNSSLLKQIPMQRNDSVSDTYSSVKEENEEFNVRSFLNPDGTFKEDKNE